MRVSQNAAQSEFCSSPIHHNKTLYDKGYSPGIPETIYRKVNEETPTNQHSSQLQSCLLEVEAASS